jgi:hypothetical protein
MHLPKTLHTFLITAAITGCGVERATQPTSDLQAFSASASATNQALLMTAPSYTPGMAGMFNRDLANFKAVLADPEGNYNFTVTDLYYVGHQQMESSIATAAAKVSADGTLMVFITAHGSQNGMIQPQGQNYATFSYHNILRAIRAGRKDLGKFKRFVLFISACYSGSWLYSVPRDVEEFAEERLVLTSVDPRNLSTIGAATSAMFQTFNQFKNKSDVSMRTFLNTYKQRNYLGQWSAVPETILDEPLIHAAR